jgi:hypothetical protein
MGRVGEALAAYERAAALDPADAELAAAVRELRLAAPVMVTHISDDRISDVLG